MSRIHVTLVLCGAVVIQLLAGSGLLSDCRCATEPSVCCRTPRPAIAKPPCCCAHKTPAIPSCCQPQNPEPKPCRCCVYKTPEATPPTVEVRDEAGQTLALCQDTANALPAGRVLSQCSRGSRTPVPISSGHRLQSLLCIWTI